MSIVSGLLVVEVVSFPILLYIVLSSPVGRIRGHPRFYTSINTIMRVYLGVENRVQGWRYHIFHLQLSCQGLKKINFLDTHNILKSLCWTFHHFLLQRSWQVSWKYQYWIRLPLLFIWPKNAIISLVWWSSSPNSPTYCFLWDFYCLLAQRILG